MGTNDLVQGTLDLLILKTIALEPKHGTGVLPEEEYFLPELFPNQPASLPARVTSDRSA
jgi:PadR family transcriptional regulator, regulatory protein PadR